jgi:hypothetical protein
MVVDQSSLVNALRDTCFRQKTVILRRDKCGG